MLHISIRSMYFHTFVFSVLHVTFYVQFTSIFNSYVIDVRLSCLLLINATQRTYLLTIVVSIHLLIHFSTHLCHHPHSRHPSLLFSFTPGSKPTFSANPFHRRFLLPTGLPHDNGTGPDLSRSSFYF